MTEQDRPALAHALMLMGDTFNEPVGELRAEGYFDALRDLEIGDVLTACREAIRTARFFPRPVELRDTIEGHTEDRAEMAWILVQREVRRVGYTGVPEFPDTATERAALELYGGWDRLCACLPASGPELLGVAKQFKSTFGAYARRDQREVAGLLGASKQDARKALANVKAELVKRGLPTGAL